MTDVLKMNSLGFEPLSHDEMMDIDGGSTKVVAGVAAIVTGVCAIGAGVAAICGAPKVAAVFGIVGGAARIVSGVCALIPAP